MSLLSFFNRRSSAPVARERLQILLAHERGIVGGESDLVSLLREEIVALVRRHITVERDNIQVKMNRGGDVSTLEIEVEIPSASGAPIAARA
ncbi:cell division topological specificity factor MinE [Microvirga antarctica]|uniref:cell division topological specificity factor MinE n=1 Tax=Microvirga antarctica TaxID=2819233 RepID=UPI001B307AAA|nr:cell division topological specificity factor MinE [Microvirga antarctica]